MSEMSYDAEADALYICLVAPGHSSSDVLTYEAEGGVLVDFWDGRPHGIEVLNASRHPIFASLLSTVNGGTLKRFWTATTLPAQEEGTP